MFFTEEDYKKIELYLIHCGVKDSSLEGAVLPFKGNEKIAIVQDGENRTIHFKELIEALNNSKASLSDLYNVTEHAKEKYITLKQAIELVPYKARKIGLIITFLNPNSKWELRQFTGTSLLQWNELSEWKDFLNLDEHIVKSILPDEEDLTKSEQDSQGNSYLSLKDREYNPAEFSGLGRVILRKNIMEVESKEHGKVKKNILLQDMINKPNTIYEIRYDFDLNNQEITIPEGCVLDFLGGSLSNGGIHGMYTSINSSIPNILYKIFLTGTYNSLFNFDWFYYKNIDLKDIIKTSNLVFLFSNKTYTLNISPWVIPEGTVFKGLSGELNTSTLNLLIKNSNNNFYLWKVSPKCTIKDLSFRLLEVTESIFLLLDTSISKNADYGTTINNIHITGHWVNSDEEYLKGTGIAIYIRDYNDDGSYAKESSLSFSLLSYHDITIKNLGTGITVQAHKKYKDDKLLGCWATAIYFYNLELWTDLGVKIMSQYLLHKEDPNIDNSLLAFIDDLRFDGFVYLRMGKKNKYNKAMYGGPSHITINNMSLWDTADFGNLIGTIVVGASRRLMFGYGNIINWGINPILGEEDKLDVRSTSDYQRDKIFLAVNSKSEKEYIPKAYEIKAGLYGGISMICNTKDLERTSTNASLMLGLPEWNEGVSNSISRKDPDVTIPYYLIIYPMNDLYSKITKDSLLPYFKIRYKDLYEEGFKKFNIFPILTENLNTNDKVQDPKLIYSIILDKNSENTYLKINNEYINIEGTHIIGRTYGNTNNLNDLTAYKGWGKGIKFFNLDTKQTFFGEKISTENDIYWYDAFGNPYNAKNKGDSSNRPLGVQIKFLYYDTDMNQFILWDGAKWVTYDGLSTEIQRSGTFTQKPTTEDNIPVGFEYFCTDKQTTEGTTNGIMIYHKGNNVWVDALGRVVN